jgi:hypothetical protein
VLLWHRLTCAGRQPWPGAGAAVPAALRKELATYDVIVTGDNHQQFVAGAWLVNPGSMMRMTSDQVDHEPAVYGWRATDNSITRLPLPCAGALKIVATATETHQHRDERMAAYITRVGRQYEQNLSFEKNLEAHFTHHRERPAVRALAWKAVSTDGND